MRVCKYILLLAWAVMPALRATAQEEKKQLVIDLSYNVHNNQFPYLVVYTKVKEEKKFIPVPGMEVNVYFNEATEPMLLNKVITAGNGRAKIPIDARFRQAWDSAAAFRFIATSAGSELFEGGETEINIRKAKIFLDTVESAEVRTLAARVMEQNAGNALPAGEVELKVFIRRMAGSLSVGDEELYTTDSSGTALAEFNKDSIPGDREGYIMVIARTEDNDTYGNLSVERSLRWGIPPVVQTDFNRRTLFATRDKSPVWLLVLAYSTAIGVWATIIYLLTRIVVIRRAGMAAGDIA